MTRIALVAFLGTAFWTGCALKLQWPDHRVRVDLDVIGLPASSTLVTADGLEARPDDLIFSFWSITLEPCDTSLTPPNSLTLAHLLSFIGPSEAHAHAVRAPNRIWRSQIIPFSSTGPTQQELGVMSPPPGQYCSLNILLAGADDDAIGAQAHPSMIGHSVHATGHWRPSSHDTWQPFAWTTPRTIERRLAFDQPLTLDSETAAELTLVLRLDIAALFHGVRFDAARDAALDDLLSQVRDSLTLEHSS